jgi:LPXTG-site transpeptidase (sortase) family protein
MCLSTSPISGLGGRLQAVPPQLIRNPWAIGSAALVLVAAAIVGVILLLPSGSTATPVEETYGDTPAATEPVAPPTPTRTRSSVLDGANTPEPTPPPHIAPISRLKIPRIGVDAEVRAKGVDSTNTMESPDGPEDVAWYNFTAKTGLGAGNAVYSGHVDYINYGDAVFADVDQLVEGDVIEVQLEDGTLVQFAVTASHVYAVNEIPMEEVLAPTSTESVTLITCGGQFSQGAYTHRLVVRATITGVVAPPAS